MVDTTAATAELVEALSPPRAPAPAPAPDPAPAPVAERARSPDDDPMATFLHNAEVICAQTAPDSAPPPAAAAPPPAAAAPPPAAALVPTAATPMGSGFGFLSATTPTAASPAARPPAAGGMMMDANMFNLSASPLASAAAPSGGFSALLAAPPSAGGLGAISDADVSSLAGSLGLPRGSVSQGAGRTRSSACPLRPSLGGRARQPTSPSQSAAQGCPAVPGSAVPPGALRAGPR